MKQQIPSKYMASVALIILGVVLVAPHLSPLPALIGGFVLMLLGVFVDWGDKKYGDYDD